MSEVQGVLTNNPPELCETCSDQHHEYEDKLLISLAGLKQVTAWLQTEKQYLNFVTIIVFNAPVLILTSQITGARRSEG